jgi:hypothetical protein
MPNQEQKLRELLMLTITLSQRCEGSGCDADYTRLNKFARRNTIADDNGLERKKHGDVEVWKQTRVMETDEFAVTHFKFWSGRRKSNPYPKLGKLLIKL